MLYHLSFDLEPPLLRTFTPRVPKLTLPDEDRSVKRICFSDSILGCMNSVSEVNIEDKYEEDGFLLAVLYCIDPRDLPSSSLITPEELYERDLVSDAPVTREYWCTAPFRMSGQVIDLLETSSRDHLVYCAKEEFRDDIYDIIDRVCNYYASEHLQELNQYSLIYLLNDYFSDPAFPFSWSDTLDNIWMDLSSDPNSAIKIDSFNVYPEMCINGETVFFDTFRYRARCFPDPQVVASQSLDSRIREIEAARKGLFLSGSHSSPIDTPHI